MQGGNLVKTYNCKACGGPGLEVKDGFVTCSYCGSRFRFSADDFDFYGNRNNGSNISLGGDIERLLLKCKADPRNARKYANLILDIDPDNLEALKYL